jgi:exodeoxyribonuclease III
LRLITWNCRVGGFRRKAQYVATLRRDILAVQEVEPIDDATVFAGDTEPTFRDRVGDPNYPRRAIGTFSYTDTILRPVDREAPLFSFRRYEATHRGLSFNVVAVWPWQTKSVKTAYRQVHEGLVLHARWIGERPTVVLGDFNANASFKGKNWPDLAALLSQLGLVSAYHQYFGQEPGQERCPTYFHRCRQDAPFHLDYCFIPRDWVPSVSSVQVGAYADWHKISDHVPLIVDLAL